MPGEARSMVAAARTAGLDAPVPSCPDWDVTALLRHVGKIHRWVALVLATGDMNVPRPEGTPPRGAELFPWVETGADELLASGLQAGPTATVSNWAQQPPVAAFWFRRMANEVGVHAWDARNAAGDPEPIEAELAADAIDEWLTVMGPLRAPEGLTGTVHIHCTDVIGDWTVDLASFATQRGSAEADAELRGPASGLLLRLLNRSDDGEVLGDPDVLARWGDKARF
ncbi:MAG TPA: maleylpyruvate isomerase family mycothiol-dependent enzyme [Acidimicrobiales bacterium]|nr:maleylpyruvate isomerase family mycothiol-dependent enzyme [Acidimicrobiales bacterium]